MSDIKYRRFSPDDQQALFMVFLHSLNDLRARLGLELYMNPDDPDDVAQQWRNFGGMLDHIAANIDQCWLAEMDGVVVGFARTMLRENVRQLTEFFIAPQAQSRGVGRELLARTFPAEGAANRVIIATGDARALARYMKSGVYPRFNLCTFSQPEPQTRSIESDLSIAPLTDSPATLAALNAIDREIIGYQREVDHRWLMQGANRTGYAFSRGGEIVGYGYFGGRSGPIALLDTADFPYVLAYGEGLAAENARTFSISVPFVNRAALDYMLSHHAQIDTGFMEFFLTAEPLGQYDHYIVTSPNFFT